MTELQAALGLAALERFPEQVKQRAELASYADKVLSKVPGVRVLPMDKRQTTRSFYRYVFAIDEEVFGSDHQAVSYALNMEGIPSQLPKKLVNMKQSGWMKESSVRTGKA